MAQSEPKTILQQLPQSSQDIDTTAAPSNSTSSQRHSYDDSQRVGRHRRLTSGATQFSGTSNSESEQVSYQEPDDFENLDESRVPPPIDAHEDEDGKNLEAVRARQGSDATRLTKTSNLKGKQVSYEVPEDFENLDEEAVSPPIDGQNEERRENLEDVEGKDQSAEADRLSATKRRSSRSRWNSLGRRVSGATRHTLEQRLPETAVPPPVQELRQQLSSERSSSQSSEAQKQTELEEAERGHYANDKDALSAPAPFAQNLPREHLPTNKSEKARQAGTPKWLTETYTISYLIFFSILGTLARLGVQWLTFYPGAPVVTPVLWANFGGSLFMGFLAEDQGLFRDDGWISSSATSEKLVSSGQNHNTAELGKTRKAEKTKIKKAIPLYIGLATGFCGSFTSFSSFARDSFLALSNNLPTPDNHLYVTPANSALSTTTTVDRNGGYSFLAFSAVVIITLALSLGALIFGAHLALFLESVTPRIPTRLCHRFFDPLAVFLGWGSWLGAVILCIWPPDRPGGPSSHENSKWEQERWRGEVLFALAFAPVGCLLRFYASLKLNGLIAAFPLGTFAVNMLGTAIEGICWDIQHVGVGLMGAIGGGRVGCQVLQGFMDGFCGCLTTVSTWVAEINGLRRSHGYAYAGTTVLGGLCLMVVIMGSVKWSVGWRTPVCNTGYTAKTYG